MTDEEIETLPYLERCKIFNNNPVLVARHFQYRAKVFFKEIILHGPLGKANMIIETPIGRTKVITAEKIKQGTVYEPQMCCSSTAKVNTIGERPTTIISPNMKTEALIYVDDIAAVGSKETIETTGINLRKMENMKKFMFSVEKSNWMIIRTEKKQKNEQPWIEKGKGKVQQAE